MPLKTKVSLSQERTSPVPSPLSSRDLGHGTRKEKRMWKTDTFAPYNDGYQWRKYGEKKINNSKFPRYYYRCTYKENMNCPATKQFQQKDCNDPPLYSVIYYNEHSCNKVSTPVTTADPPLQPSTGKAVSICFDSYGIQEPRTFCSPSTSAVPHGMRSGDNSRPLSPYSDAHSCGADSGERRQAWTDFLSCSSTVSHNVFSADSVSGETSAAGKSSSITYYHFL